jgi:hypothetical protein
MTIAMRHRARRASILDGRFVQPSRAAFSMVGRGKTCRRLGLRRRLAGACDVVRATTHAYLAAPMAKLDFRAAAADDHFYAH